MKPAASDPHSNDKRMGPVAPLLASGNGVQNQIAQPKDAA